MGQGLGAKLARLVLRLLLISKHTLWIGVFALKSNVGGWWLAVGWDYSVQNKRITKREKEWKKKRKLDSSKDVQRKTKRVNVI